MSTVVETMKRFNELITSGHFQEALDYLVRLEPEITSAFNKPTKIKVIELVREPGPECLIRALTNREWITASMAVVDEAFVSALSQARKVSSTPAAPEEAAVAERPATTKRGHKSRGKGFTLADLASDEPKVVPAPAEAVPAAEATGATVIKVEPTADSKALAILAQLIESVNEKVATVVRIETAGATQHADVEARVKNLEEQLEDVQHLLVRNLAAVVLLAVSTTEFDLESFMGALDTVQDAVAKTANDKPVE